VIRLSTKAPTGDGQPVFYRSQTNPKQMTATFQTNLTHKSYNGWSNYETWNVALWIQNDEGLYHIAKECGSWDCFQEVMIDDFGKTATPDGVLYNDPELNQVELSELFTEL